MYCATKSRLLAAVAFLFAVQALSATQAVAQVAIPQELRGWEDWVRHGHETHACPWLAPESASDSARVCAWAAPLEVAADEHGARFSQRWQAAAETWVPLPGSAETWPEEVTLDGSPASLVTHDGTPALRVTAGAHTLAGVFRWAHRPELLPVPTAVALVSLTLNGARVANPRRTDAGIMLGARAAARQDDHVDVHVYRRLDDEQPALLTTEVELSVAGEAREIVLPAALPEGFVPTAIEGPLAARLDPDNTLRVQVRPGEFTLTLEARGAGPAASARLGARASPWPGEEIWSFKGEDRLRVAALEGVPAVDPAQANVPGDWRDLPAYRVGAADTVRVVERSRGLSAADANDLKLQRTAWLDFGGAGYTIVDRITGQMRQDWRLDVAPPYRLESAHTQADQPLLVTEGTTRGLTGVELRDPQVDLTAVSRLDRAGGAVPATGWHARLTQVSGLLIAGPGYRLLAAIGPDAAPQAWLERWRLLDIFGVLLTVIVALRVLGLRTALIAAAATILTYQESGSPTWLWLAVLIALALQRAAPDGRLRRLAGGIRLAVFVLLVLVLVPFAVGQARLAVYPQLEGLAPQVYALHAEMPPVETPLLAEAKRNYAPAAVPAPPPPATLSSIAATPINAPVAEVVVTGERRQPLERYEPGALIQAGPGLPDWTYHVYSYSWSGPVDESTTARFLMSPPWLTRLWRIAGLILAGWLVFALIPRDLPFGPTAWRARPLAGLSVLFLGLVLCASATPVRAATTPDAVLLDELRTRLLAPPKCAPDCAAILAATVTATPAHLQVSLSVSALDAVGLPLPGAGDNWSPEAIAIDGAAAGLVFRKSDGVRYVNLTRGHHVVRLEGALGAIEGLSLAFPMPPRIIDVNAPDWDAGGVSDRHLVSGALELVRRQAATHAPGAAARPQEFPPFVYVDRLFHLSHEWTIDTTVTRLAPKSAAFTANLPLLATESITTPGLKATDGRVAVGFGAGEDEETFNSGLAPTGTLELTADTESAYVERWRFEVGPTWHVAFTGLPAVMPEEQSRAWTFEYYPRAGERLQVQITRPAAVSGGTVAFDQVRMHTAFGKHSSDTTLELDYRSTQGGRQALHIPDGANVTRVLSDGQPVALRPEGGELSLVALPGRHNWSVDWQTGNGARFVTRSAAVSLGAPASNLRLAVQLPEDRWVLFAFGQGVGPTILYWGELLVFLAAAWLFGRSALTPLPTLDWLLLGLGLSTFSWFALALFAVFIGVFQWRARGAPMADPARARWLQAGCAVLALVALVAVVYAVPQGLLAHPDMRVEPAGTGGEYRWFDDQTSGALPTPGVLSVSLWWYKAAMLAWALWLSFALTRWIKWAWQVFTRDGLWPTAAKAAPAPPAPPA